MAYVQSDAIETAIYEVLTGAFAGTRAIAAGTYASNQPEGLAEWGAQVRAIETPRVSVRWGITGRSPQSPGVNANVLLYDATIEVVVSRAAPRADAVSQSLRSAVTSALVLDADRIRQALEFPGNLEETQAGDITDIVSGTLRFMSSAPPTAVGSVDDGAQRYEMTLVFSAVLLARPADPVGDPLVSSTGAFIVTDTGARLVGFTL